MFPSDRRINNYTITTPPPREQSLLSKFSKKIKAILHGSKNNGSSKSRQEHSQIFDRYDPTPRAPTDAPPRTRSSDSFATELTPPAPPSPRIPSNIGFSDINTPAPASTPPVSMPQPITLSTNPSSSQTTRPATTNPTKSGTPNTVYTASAKELPLLHPPLPSQIYNLEKGDRALLGKYIYKHKGDKFTLIITDDQTKEIDDKTNKIRQKLEKIMTPEDAKALTLLSYLIQEQKNKKAQNPNLDPAEKTIKSYERMLTNFLAKNIQKIYERSPENGRFTPSPLTDNPLADNECLISSESYKDLTKEQVPIFILKYPAGNSEKEPILQICKATEFRNYTLPPPLNKFTS